MQSCHRVMTLVHTYIVACVCNWRPGTVDVRFLGRENPMVQCWEKSMGEIEINLKLWNVPGDWIKLENNQVKSIKSHYNQNSSLLHVCQLCFWILYSLLIRRCLENLITFSKICWHQKRQKIITVNNFFGKKIITSGYERSK